MEKIWCIRLLLLGLLCVAGFYSLLKLKRIWKECKCYIPDFLQEDPIYVFVACRQRRTIGMTINSYNIACSRSFTVSGGSRIFIRGMRSFPFSYPLPFLSPPLYSHPFPSLPFCCCLAQALCCVLETVHIATNCCPFLPLRLALYIGPAREAGLSTGMERKKIHCTSTLH